MSTTLDAPRRRIGRMLVIGILAATCARVWLAPGEVLPRAVAQIPDSGLQRRQMLDEIRRTNQLLEQIHHTLQTETIKVTMEGTDKTKDRTAASRPPTP
ncbi:MAG: hypothetical protein V2A79_17210 [Planctomycetota bacterium]